MHQQRVVNVLLDYEGAVAIFLHRPPNDRLHLSYRFDNRDSLASVSVLARLNDPGVLGRPVLLANLFDGLFILVRLCFTAIVIVCLGSS